LADLESISQIRRVHFSPHTINIFSRMYRLSKLEIRSMERGIRPTAVLYFAFNDL